MHERTACAVFEVESLLSVPRDSRRSAASRYPDALRLQVKYLHYTLIAEANGWTDASVRDIAKAQASFRDACDAYRKELDGLVSRVSGPAWQFFRHGSGEHGLHDGRLLSFSLGDGLSYSADGSTPFLRNRSASSASFSFLNFEQTYLYSFGVREVRKCFVSFDSLDAQVPPRFGDLYLCELTGSDGDDLRLSFLFADEPEISVVFRRLVFRRRRLRQSYLQGDIYR